MLIHPYSIRAGIGDRLVPQGFNPLSSDLMHFLDLVPLLLQLSYTSFAYSYPTSCCSVGTDSVSPFPHVLFSDPVLPFNISIEVS